MTDKDTILAYFQSLSGMYAPSTLISIASKKVCILLYEKVVIGDYEGTKRIIKRRNQGHQKKKASILNMDKNSIVCGCCAR